jgi:DNA-directed RNA polymerase alpha subunit
MRKINTEGYRGRMNADFPKDVASPARRALASIGVERLEDLRTKDRAELAKLHGMGPKALKALAEALAERGWAFGDQK